jgi:fatty acid desaturase
MQPLPSRILRRGRCGSRPRSTTETDAARSPANASWPRLSRSSYQLLIAAFLAIAFTQVAFLGHDAGHRQIFASRRANDLLGFLHGNLLVVSFGWWVDKHSRHHAHPTPKAPTRTSPPAH